MILFQKEYNEIILSGEKRFTIRRGDRSKRIKVGSIHKCKNKIFTKDYFAKIRILNLTVKPFSELTEQDAKDDLFDSLEECKERLIELNGEEIRDMLVTKIEFEVV